MKNNKKIKCNEIVLNIIESILFGMFANIISSLIYVGIGLLILVTRMWLKQQILISVTINFWRKNHNFFWPYGRMGWILLGAIIVILCVLKWKSRWKLWLLKYKLSWKRLLVIIDIISLIILFGILIFITKNPSINWWVWLDTICWGLLFFLVYHRDISKDQCESNNKDAKFNSYREKNKLKNKKDSNTNRQYKTKLINAESYILGCISSYKYVIKRLVTALVISAIASVFISLYYAVKFRNVKMALRSFLNLQTYADNSAYSVISNIYAAIFIILPTVIFVVATMKIQRISSEISEIFEKDQVMKLRIKKEKIIFRAICFIIWSITSLFVVIILPAWAKPDKLTANMIITLGGILFAFSLMLIYLISTIIDWLKKDNTKNLPRTTIFLGFMATILAAIISIIK
ncbi:hypothetical protein [Lactobacillus intestinalis]|uniref:hypothetical protein n=1 Tax=Lactobacillus intestinalis TaxID=151781 RepID=UPI001F5921B4|nr:hypothetical protein [Lactobacillus intestinalis]